MNNELTIFNANSNPEMRPYCSLQPTDEKSANIIFKAMNNPDESIGDFINQDIEVAGIFVQSVDMADSDTGELKRNPRVVIFDSEDNTYSSVSTGIYQALTNVCTLIGSPEQWLSPIRIKVLQKKVKRGSMLTFEVIDWGENFNTVPEF